MLTQLLYAAGEIEGEVLPPHILARLEGVAIDELYAVVAVLKF
jgi:hypothetical protein